MSFNIIDASSQNLPAIVCVVDDRLLSKLKHDSEFSESADELQRNNHGIFVVAMNGSPRSPWASKIRRAELSVGDVWVQSPFDNAVYYSLCDAGRQLSIDKYTFFTRACQLLGATKVELIEVIECSDGSNEEIATGGSAKTTGECATKIGVIGGGIDGHYSDKRSHSFAMMFRQGIQMTSAFVGGAARIEEAQIYLKDAGMIDDRDIARLVSLRSDDKNICNTHDMVVDVVREVRRSMLLAHVLNLSIQASIKRIGKLKSSYSETSENEIKYWQKNSIQARSKINF
jgi:CBS domain-containing protein